MKLININFLIVLFSLYSFGQNKDSIQIKILPKWEINDIQKLKIKMSEKEIINNKTTLSTILFNCSFKIQEKNENGYIISWTFDNSKIIEGKLNNNQSLLTRFMNKDILIKSNKFGEFIEISNYEDIRIFATKKINNLIATETNKQVKLDLSISKELISTKEGIESILLKTIKTYFLPFGHQYPLNLEMTYNLKYPNVLGGTEPYDAIEKVTLTIPEIKNNICVIKSNQIIDPNQFLKELTLILKNKLNYKSNDIKKFVQKYKVGLTENKIHYVDLNTGIQQKLILKRIIDMKILTKYIDYEYEIVN